jgi:V8-like Glu-specific endopeptidase
MRRTSKALRAWAALVFSCIVVAVFVAVPQTSPFSGPRTTVRTMSPHHRSAWTSALLMAARAVSGQHLQPKTGHALAAPPHQVGALLYHDAGGAHFCTASVVDSPGRNVIATAAHCVQNGPQEQDLVFAPGYSQGRAPYGVWEPKSVVVDQRWIDSADPDLDVAFVVMQPKDGKNVGDVLGSHPLATDQPDRLRVRVTGYPNNDDGPITCHNRTNPLSRTQRRFACGGYAPGTSGSPWISDAGDPRGALVGVIGGYEQGGSEDNVSYSADFGSDVRQLYDEALAQS